MITSRMRPTFSFPTSLGAPEAFDQLRQRITTTGELLGQFADGHAIISIAESRRHFWSPWLHLEVRETADGNEIFGRFSPHPSIWTGFMFAYLSLAVIVFFAFIVLMAQLMVKQTPWGALPIPVCGFFALALWIASQAGQKLAWVEMASMKQIVAEGLSEPGNH